MFSQICVWAISVTTAEQAACEPLDIWQRLHFVVMQCSAAQKAIKVLHIYNNANNSGVCQWLWKGFLVKRCNLCLCLCVSTACLFRYNGLSFVYLIYLLLIPLFPEPTCTTMQGKCQTFIHCGENRTEPKMPRVWTAMLFLCNMNQPSCRGLGFLWDEDGFGIKFSLWKVNSVSVSVSLSEIPQPAWYQVETCDSSLPSPIQLGIG